MKNSKLRRALLLVASAVLLVCVSVGATLAYLTDDDSVENTFTVGHIYIHLDETDKDNDTDTDDVVDCDSNNHTGRDQKNTYHIVPDATFDKDPAVWVEEKSEKMFLFIKVYNELKDIEVASSDVDLIDTQITKNGWTPLTTFIDPESKTKVYYRVFDPKTPAPFIATDGEYKIPTFTKVHITSNLDNTSMANYANAKITVNAYAIQWDGMNDNADEAWTALNNQMNP